MSTEGAIALVSSLARAMTSNIIAIEVIVIVVAVIDGNKFAADVVVSAIRRKCAIAAGRLQNGI